MNCKALCLTGHVGVSEQDPETVTVLKWLYLVVFLSVSSLKSCLNTHTHTHAKKKKEQKLEERWLRKNR